MKPIKKEVRPERTGWRDEWISRRHRTWVVACTAVDLDFLLVEYNFGEPVALVEYKYHKAQDHNTKHPTYRSLSKLANMANLPFVVARYWREPCAFKVFPINDYSKMHFVDGEILTERGFVKKLYKLRNLKIGEKLEGQLNDVLPDGLRHVEWF